jgi:hypothetical protein
MGSSKVVITVNANLLVNNKRIVRHEIISQQGLICFDVQPKTELLRQKFQNGFFEIPFLWEVYVLAYEQRSFELNLHSFTIFTRAVSLWKKGPDVFGPFVLDVWIHLLVGFKRLACSTLQVFMVHVSGHKIS